uniref:putative RNA-binding protein 15B n=1 Tax=Lonchura striata TaxID=40157 RepID=UPI000B4DD8DC|nr:putative RNA-binding protein 15B [Lonchura striata domestica]
MREMRLRRQRGRRTAGARRGAGRARAGPGTRSAPLRSAALRGRRRRRAEAPPRSEVRCDLRWSGGDGGGRRSLAPGDPATCGKSGRGTGRVWEIPPPPPFPASTPRLVLPGESCSSTEGGA